MQTINWICKELTYLECDIWQVQIVNFPGTVNPRVCLSLDILIYIYWYRIYVYCTHLHLFCLNKTIGTKVVCSANLLWTKQKTIHTRGPLSFRTHLKTYHRTHVQKRIMLYIPGPKWPLFWMEERETIKAQLGQTVTWIFQMWQFSKPGRLAPYYRSLSWWLNQPTNPFEKYQWSHRIISLRFGVKIKNLWHHHLDYVSGFWIHPAAPSSHLATQTSASWRRVSIFCRSSSWQIEAA